MKNRKGLSLIEILVALIITGIIAACVSAAVIGGYYMLKQAEHKSRAMSISHVKLQEYLAKSFEGLGPDAIISGNADSISPVFTRTQDNTFFNWTVKVERGGAGGVNNVPYKNVTVETLYTEINTKGAEVSKKTIRLSNIVPYPLIHINGTYRDFKGQPQDYAANPTTVPYHDGMTDAECNWNNITTTAGAFSFEYAVPLDVIVFYNLAITYDTAVAIDPTDTVLTRSILDGDAAKQYGIITRTPIMTQVFINNIFTMGNVSAGPHTINIEWAKDRHYTGSVWLRAYDITIIGIENSTQRAAIP